MTDSLDHYVANMENLNLRLQEIESLNSKFIIEPNEDNIQNLRGLIHRAQYLIDYDLQFRKENGKSEDLIKYLSESKRRIASTASNAPKPVKKQKIVEIASETKEVNEEIKEVKLPSEPMEIDIPKPPSRRSRTSTRATTPPEIDIPDSLDIKAGELVAVKTDEWILGNILSIYHEPTKNINKTKYSLIDFDDKKTIIKNKLRKHIMRLPSEASNTNLNHSVPLKHTVIWPEFKAGAQVFAVFPDTTSLYEAKVLLPPSQFKKNIYKLIFDDDPDTPFREVDVRFVTRPDLRKIK